MAVDRARAESGMRELLALYRDAQRIIAAEVREAIRSGNLGRRDNRVAAYRAIERYLAGVGVQSDRVAADLIESAWREGERSVLDAVEPNRVGYEFSTINRDAMVEMQQALNASLGQMRGTVGRQVADVFRRAGLRSVALGQLGALGSRRKVSADMVNRLQQQGIKAFTDRAGRQWQLKNYAEMVARTTTREAVVAAQISRMGAMGIEFARVSRNGSSCPICGPQEGVLVSLGAGGTLDGETAATLDALPNGGPPFHPNCRHWLDPETGVF